MEGGIEIQNTADTSPLTRGIRKKGAEGTLGSGQ